MLKRKNLIVYLIVFIFLILTVFPMPFLERKNEAIVFIPYAQLESFGSAKVEDSYVFTQWEPSFGLFKWKQMVVSYSCLTENDKWQFYKCENVKMNFAGFHFFTGFDVEQSQSSISTTNSLNDTLSITVKGHYSFPFYVGRSKAQNLKIILVP